MVATIDLTDLDMWARGAPYSEFARLRRETPVAWFGERPPNHGYWSVHRYADIVAASKDTTTFSSSRGVSFEEPTDEDMAARTTIIDLDPPEHTRLRKVVFGAFTQRAVARYQDFVTRLTEQVLDQAPDGPFDFVAHVAKAVPIRVLAEIMGLPSTDLDLFIDLGDRLIANTDPEVTDVVWGRDDTDAYRKYPFRSPYGKQLWDLGRRVIQNPHADDILGRVLDAGLSQTDLDNFFSIMVIAGNETTRITIAQGVLAFAQFPEQWDRLRADESLLESATDEVLRWTCPTHFMRRTAATGTTLGGARIRKGDKVILWYVSGNRDEAEFDNPDTFDVARDPNRHLSFGRGGPHLCLGLHLARLEVKVVLAALAQRVTGFELAGDPVRIRSNFTNGLRALPIRMGRA
ncbi:MAG TPA: cytochrome P450 [Streptosporangiaceae bacterium]|nr:cytochrome P450 [Streptosporangiaceae bacterium]